MKIFIMSDLGLRTGMSRLSALNFFVRKKWLSALEINSKSWPADGLIFVRKKWTRGLSALKLSADTFFWPRLDSVRDIK